MDMRNFALVAPVAVLLVACSSSPGAPSAAPSSNAPTKSSCVSVSEADITEIVDKAKGPEMKGKVAHDGKAVAVPIQGGYLVRVHMTAPGVDGVGVWKVGGLSPAAGPVLSANFEADMFTAWPKADIDTGQLDACPL